MNDNILNLECRKIWIEFLLNYIGIPSVVAQLEQLRELSFHIDKKIEEIKDSLDQVPLYEAKGDVEIKAVPMEDEALTFSLDEDAISPKFCKKRTIIYLLLNLYSHLWELIDKPIPLQAIKHLIHINRLIQINKIDAELKAALLEAHTILNAMRTIFQNKSGYTEFGLFTSADPFQHGDVSSRDILISNNQILKFKPSGPLDSVILADKYGFELKRSELELDNEKINLEFMRAFWPHIPQTQSAILYNYNGAEIKDGIASKKIDFLSLIKIDIKHFIDRVIKDEIEGLGVITTFGLLFRIDDLKFHGNIGLSQNRYVVVVDGEVNDFETVADNRKISSLDIALLPYVMGYEFYNWLNMYVREDLDEEDESFYLEGVESIFEIPKDEKIPCTPRILNERNRTILNFSVLPQEFIRLFIRCYARSREIENVIFEKYIKYFSAVTNAALENEDFCNYVLSEIAALDLSKSPFLDFRTVSGIHLAKVVPHFKLMLESGLNTLRQHITQSRLVLKPTIKTMLGKRKEPHTKADKSDESKTKRAKVNPNKFLDLPGLLQGVSGIAVLEEYLQLGHFTREELGNHILTQPYCCIAVTLKFLDDRGRVLDILFPKPELSEMQTKIFQKAREYFKTFLCDPEAGYYKLIRVKSFLEGTHALPGIENDILNYLNRLGFFKTIFYPKSTRRDNYLAFIKDFPMYYALHRGQIDGQFREAEVAFSNDVEFQKLNVGGKGVRFEYLR